MFSGIQNFIRGGDGVNNAVPPAPTAQACTVIATPQQPNTTSFVAHCGLIVLSSIIVIGALNENVRNAYTELLQRHFRNTLEPLTRRLCAFLSDKVVPLFKAVEESRAGRSHEEPKGEQIAMASTAGVEKCKSADKDPAPAGTEKRKSADRSYVMVHSRRDKRA